MNRRNFLVGLFSTTALVPLATASGLATDIAPNSMFVGRSSGKYYWECRIPGIPTTIQWTNLHFGELIPFAKDDIVHFAINLTPQTQDGGG